MSLNWLEIGVDKETYTQISTYILFYFYVPRFNEDDLVMWMSYILIKCLFGIGSFGLLTFKTEPLNQMNAIYLFNNSNSYKH